MAKRLRICVFLILMLLVLPPASFMLFYDPANDTGHPRMAIIPLMWVGFGFAFIAPIGVALGIASLRLAEPAVTRGRRNWLVAATVSLGIGSVLVWGWYAIFG